MTLTLVAFSAFAQAQPVFRITTIPEEAATEQVRKFTPLANYLEKQLGMKVVFTPVTDYPAAVESLVNKKVDVVWFGGFTFVQASIRSGGKIVPVAQREEDTRFQSVFIAKTNSGIKSLADMKGKFLDVVTNIDIDESVHAASSDLNSVTKSTFRTSNRDVRKLNIEKYSKPIVIDTIVEHFTDHGEWVKTLPKKAMIVLQGNDMFDVPEHVNCHRTLEEFVASCGLNNIIWSGELNLYKCTRYMAIGTT